VELASVAVSLLLAMVLIVMGLAKVQSLPATLRIRDRLGLSSASWRVLGVVELLAAAGLIVGSLANTKMAIVASALAAGSAIALMAAQVRVREPRAFLVPGMLVLVVAAVDIALLAASG
jgi:DoxX-like family